jgi:hypothetical protein
LRASSPIWAASAPIASSSSSRGLISASRSCPDAGDADRFGWPPRRSEQASEAVEESRKPQHPRKPRQDGVADDFRKVVGCRRRVTDTEASAMIDVARTVVDLDAHKASIRLAAVQADRWCAR